MKRIDFSTGNIHIQVLQTAMPVLVAQVLNLLYNIVDRIYISRIPGVGTTALGAVGICFPLIILISAFTFLFGNGGAPLFAIERGKGQDEQARELMNLSFSLLLFSGIIILILGEACAPQLLRLFGASDAAMPYSLPYLRIYLLGTVFGMIATGMNPFITAQGFPAIGMLTVTVGAISNIVLDTIFIFELHMGVQGAAIATVIAQGLAALAVVSFLRGKRSLMKLKAMGIRTVLGKKKEVLDIAGLGAAGFVMQVTNGSVQLVYNTVLVHTGGDLYVSIMAILTSVRQVFETPMFSIAEGASPIISFNYGARNKERIKKAAKTMVLLMFFYSLAIWLLLMIHPAMFISLFSPDAEILQPAIPAMRRYLGAFIFMVFMSGGQTIFKALNFKKHAIFFSLFRKAMIIIPLTYVLSYALGLGSNGVFLSEAISNVIGGTACFTTMCVVVGRKLKEMR